MIPVFRPPHREQPVANPSQRLTMLRAAVGGEPDLRVDNREMLREGISYMVDTLASLRKELGDEPLCLVLGADAFLQLHTWHRWQEILELAHIVVTHRPGWSLDDEALEMDSALSALWREHRVSEREQLTSRPCGAVIPVAVSQLDISATRIRAMVAAGDSPRFLVPDPVWNLMRLQGMYDFKAKADFDNRPHKLPIRTGSV
ncbi:MAG: nicotinate-nucleotide adenylyltransferase, partial [Gammaproteobacteria bacterium]|nr:nicotinate-nucleotide adenylyltransferase [Gammaproteobacteria bacterium]